MSDWDTMCFKSSSMCDVMSLEEMDRAMDADFLEELPQGDCPLSGLDRLETPPPTPVLLSELDGSPLSSTGLGSPPGDPETDSGGDGLLSVEALLESCGVSSVSPDSPLLSPVDLMWGASPGPVSVSPASNSTEQEPSSKHQHGVEEECSQERRPEKDRTIKENERLYRDQEKDKDKERQRQRSVERTQTVVRQHKQERHHALLVKQQPRQPPPTSQPQLQTQTQWRLQPCSRDVGEPRAGTAAKVRRKARVIRVPASTSIAAIPHILICAPSAVARPASSLPVTYSVLDRHTASRVRVRPVSAAFNPRDQSQPLGVRRRVVGRAVSLAKRSSVESSPSSPESPATSHCPPPRRRVVTATAATQTGEAVDEVLRNSDSTLLRLLVTGQDLTNGYRLGADGQCQTPERQPAPPSLFAGLPDRDSSALLSLLSPDEDPPLPALFPAEEPL